MYTQKRKNRIALANRIRCVWALTVTVTVITVSALLILT